MTVKGFAVLFVLYTFALASCVVLVRLTFAVDSGVIRVPQDYPTIQKAVNAANPGYTILVSAGTYNEHVHVNKSLNIIGEGRTNTTVWGRPVFEIQAHNVTISGFKINSGEYCVGLFDSYGCNISGNFMLGGIRAIFLYNSSNNIVAYNEIIPNPNGLGIELLINSANNVVRANRVMMASSGIGISVHACGNNKVEYNRLEHLSLGIEITNSDDNVIRGNTAENNMIGIALWPGSQRNRVYHNNLINNPCDVVEAYENFWDNGAEGNYWSDYNGTDLDGDGIGDTNLPWQGVDRHPLMDPWSPLKTFYVDEGTGGPGNGTMHAVTVLSDSTIAGFDFSLAPLRWISFKSTGPPGTVGFCNVTVPKALLRGHLLVLVDDGLTGFSLSENETHRCVYFAYTYSTRNIRIMEYTPIPGDINCDGRVDLYDIVVVATAYGARLGDENWNPDADVAPPWGIINLYDAVTILYHYGKTYQN